MARFALIAEGLTDQVVLETIIQGFYAGQLDDEVEVVFLQPVRDATDEHRQGDFGGWEKVLELCAIPERLNEALTFNDYLVIQIDTDCCEHKNFNVPITLDGRLRSVPDLVDDVISKIVGGSAAQFFHEYKDRIIFAVAVDSIECWIIPLHEPRETHKMRRTNCEDFLKGALARRNVKFDKSYSFYERLIKEYRKPKKLALGRFYNESLNIFLDSLPNLADGVPV